jgi:hypothetical protein
VALANEPAPGHGYDAASADRSSGGRQCWREQDAALSVTVELPDEQLASTPEIITTQTRRFGAEYDRPWQTSQAMDVIGHLIGSIAPKVGCAPMRPARWRIR